jgi:tetratricopeptide (TPR) repeat protein
VAGAKRNQARIAARSGRYDEAMRLFHDARAEFEDIGARVDVIDTLASMAECHVLHGHGEAALGLADEALGQAETQDGVPEQSPLLHRVRGYSLIQAGALWEARQAFDESLRAARSRQADYQVALSLQALVDLDALEGTTVRADLEEESQSILHRLGVVSVPRTPLHACAPAGR